MKNNDASGIESIVIWNAVLILSFLLLLWLGSVAPMFMPTLSSVGETLPAKVH